MCARSESDPRRGEKARLTFVGAYLSRAVPLVASCALHLTLTALLAAVVPAWTAPPMSRVLEAVIVEPDRALPIPEPEPPRPRPSAPRPTALPRLVEAPKPAVPKPAAPPEPAAPPPAPVPVAAPPVAPPTPEASPPAPTPPATRQPFAIAATEPPGAPAELKAGAERPVAPVTPSSLTAKVTPEEAVTRMAAPSGGYQVRPSYPSTARRLGSEGTSLLRVYVTADGRVTDVQVDQTAGHPDLDRAAMDAVRRWKFEPGRRGSEPVSMWVRLPVQFILK